MIFFIRGVFLLLLSLFWYKRVDLLYRILRCPLAAMVSKNCSKPSPPANFQKRGNPCSTDSDHIQETQALSSLDSGNNHGNDEDVNHNLFEQSEVDEGGVRQYPLSTEELYKRCKRFEGTEEPASVAFSFSQSSQSKMSSKNLYHEVKSRREASLTTICSLEDEEHYFAWSSQQPASASLKTNPKSPVQICLPRGFIPSNMNFQFTRRESQSGIDEEVTMEAGEEVDMWVRDTLDHVSFAEPDFIPQVVETGVTTVHDLDEEVFRKNNQLRGTFNCFRESLRASHHRNAICEELEMMTGIVKVNGARLSLWHFRKELPKTLKLSKKTNSLTEVVDA